MHLTSTCLHPPLPMPPPPLYTRLSPHRARCQQVGGKRLHVVVSAAPAGGEQRGSKVLHRPTQPRLVAHARGQVLPLQAGSQQLHQAAAGAAAIGGRWQWGKGSALLGGGNQLGLGVDHPAGCLLFVWIAGAVAHPVPLLPTQPAAAGPRLRAVAVAGAQLLEVKLLQLLLVVSLFQGRLAVAAAIPTAAAAVSVVPPLLCRKLCCHACIQLLGCCPSSCAVPSLLLLKLLLLQLVCQLVACGVAWRHTLSAKRAGSSCGIGVCWLPRPRLAIVKVGVHVFAQRLCRGEERQQQVVSAAPATPAACQRPAAAVAPHCSSGSKLAGSAALAPEAWSGFPGAHLRCQSGGCRRGIHPQAFLAALLIASLRR